MRQRTTFIQKPSAPFHPSQTTLKRDALAIQALDAAREERLTFSFDELSSEVHCLSSILFFMLRRCYGIGGELANLSVTMFTALASPKTMPSAPYSVGKYEQV